MPGVWADAQLGKAVNAQLSGIHESTQSRQAAQPDSQTVAHECFCMGSLICFGRRRCNSCNPGDDFHTVVATVWAHFNVWQLGLDLSESFNDIVMYMASGEIPDQEPPEGVQFVTYPEGWSAAHQRGVSLSYSAGTSVNSHRLGFLAPHRYELVHYVEFSGPSGPLPDDVNAVLVERLQNAFAATDLWNEQVNGNEMLEMVLAGGKIDRHIHWRGIFVNVVTPLFVFIAILFIRKLHRSFSRWREGRGRGGPLCPTCLFELRGSFQLTCCPECGQRLNWSRWSLNRKSNTGETIE